MRTLILLRHSLTAANEGRLYCGRTDLPLSPAGRALAQQTRTSRTLPKCDLYISSGMARAEETLALLTGRRADCALPDLREMDFGTFEMRSYDEMLADGDFVRWIEDAIGDVRCPGGESRNAFRRRVLNGGAALLALPFVRAMVVCHGGVIVNLMETWFPDVHRHFYEWQPAACRGYRIAVDSVPVDFEEI